MDQTFREQIASTIKEYGRQVLGIFDPEGKSPEFTYSIGNRDAGKPDLLVLAAEHRIAGRIINRVSEQDGVKFEDGEIVDLGGKFPIKLAKMDAGTRMLYTVQAEEYYQTHDYAVMQVVFADENGKFPGDEGCDPVMVQCQQLVTPKYDA